MDSITTHDVCFAYLLFVSFLYLFLSINGISKRKRIESKNEDLQEENTSLIERNEKLDTYLDETRAVVITQNKIIAELRYNEEDHEFHP